MAKIIAGVIGVLLFVVYSALFVFWNATTTANLVTFKAGSECFWLSSVPVGFLPLVGLVIGAVLMAILLIFPWAAQRRKIKELEAKVQKAILKLREQKAAITSRDEQISGLAAQIQQQSEVASDVAISKPLTEDSLDDNSGIEDAVNSSSEDTSSV